MFAIKFILLFPDDTINDSRFYKVLLNPNAKPTVISSAMMIAGYIITQDINTPNAVQLKKRIFDHMVGFLTCNNAHARCIVQYFLTKMLSNKQFGASFIPTGVMPILEYL